MPSEGADGSSQFVAGDVAFRPREFTTAINTWAEVPWCATDFAPYGDKSVDHLAAVHNPVAGIGDVCRYMGVVDGANWRMPTAADWAELYGSDQQDKGQAVVLPSSGGWIEGNYHPLRGCAMGVGRDGVKITGSGAAVRVGGADPNTCGAVFLPASGYREATANGAIYGLGDGGFFWSSTAFTHANSLLMKFYSTSVLPQYSDVRTYGLSVRCIRE